MTDKEYVAKWNKRAEFLRSLPRDKYKEYLQCGAYYEEINKQFFG